MPAFKQWNLAMSIELSFPKACFWHPTTLQPWSVSSVRRALGSVKNCKTKHPHAPLFSGWSVTGCKADYQFCNAGFQPQGIRQVFSSLRGKCQSTKVFQKFTLSTPWKSPVDCLVARLHVGTSLNIQSPAFSLTRLAWRQAMPTFNQNLKIRFLQPLLSLLLWMFNKPPTTGCSPVSWALAEGTQMSIL